MMSTICQNPVHLSGIRNGRSSDIFATFYLFSTTQPFRANVGTMVSRAIRIVNIDNQDSGPRGYLQGVSSISRLSGHAMQNERVPPLYLLCSHMLQHITQLLS